MIIPRNELINLYEDKKLSIKKIAAIYQIPIKQMRSWFQDYGIEVKGCSQRLARDAEVIRLYNDNYSFREIARITGYSIKFVLQSAKRIGLSTNRPYCKTKKRERKVNKNRRRYKLNEHTFQNIDNPNKAYWLGFLMTDGNMNKARHQIYLSLQELDAGHLVKFLQFLNADYPIKIKINEKDSKKYPQRYVCVNSVDLCDDLYRLGMIPNKTKIIKWIDFQDRDMDLAFIRGCIDGDGCWNIVGRSKSLQFSSASKDFAEGFVNTLMKHVSLQGKVSVAERPNNCGNPHYHCILFTRKDIKNVAYELYRIPGDYLERKKLSLQQFQLLD